MKVGGFNLPYCLIDLRGYQLSGFASLRTFYLTRKRDLKITRIVWLNAYSKRTGHTTIPVLLYQN